MHFKLFIVLLFALCSTAPCHGENSSTELPQSEYIASSTDSWDDIDRLVPELDDYLPSPRIVGGSFASAGQFPYQVSLRLSGSPICGGAILSSNYVVTAAHCVTGRRLNLFRPWVAESPSDLSIRVGSNLLNSGGNIVGVSRVIVHPRYRRFRNDIALLQLSTPLTLGGNVQTIPLATSEPPAGAAVVVTGWGAVTTNGDSSEILKYVTMNALSRQQCVRRLRRLGASVLCLESSTGSGLCNGDSGGPAVYNGELVGLSSFTIGNCATSAPDGLTMVSSYVDWLRSNSDL